MTEILYLIGLAACGVCGWFAGRMPMLNVLSMGREMEQVDAALGLAPLPPIRLPAAEAAALRDEAAAQGIVVQAYVRKVLANRVTPNYPHERTETARTEP